AEAAEEVTVADGGAGNAAPFEVPGPKSSQGALGGGFVDLGVRVAADRRELLSDGMGFGEHRRREAALAQDGARRALLVVAGFERFDAVGEGAHRDVERGALGAVEVEEHPRMKRRMAPPKRRLRKGKPPLLPGVEALE